MHEGFESLRVYQLAYAGAMEIFDLSKKFPPEEKYSLTDQVRRSSRSVCANIAEAYRKRRYPKHFVMKLSDADGEAMTTNHHEAHEDHEGNNNGVRYFIKSGNRVRDRGSS